MSHGPTEKWPVRLTITAETRCYICDRPMPVNMAAKVGEPQVCWGCQLANLTDDQTTAPTPSTHPHSPPTPSPQQTNSSKGLTGTGFAPPAAPPMGTPQTSFCTGCPASRGAPHPWCFSAGCPMCPRCPRRPSPPLMPLGPDA